MAIEVDSLRVVVEIFTVMVVREVSASEHDTDVAATEVLGERYPFPVLFLQVHECAQPQSVLVGVSVAALLLKFVFVEGLVEFHQVISV